MIESFLDFITSSGFFSVLKVVSFVASAITFVFLMYLFVRIMELSQEYRKRREDHFNTKGESKRSNSSQNQKQWNGIREAFQSDKESDWRMAIINADSMLDGLLIEKGYPGDTMGERLKSISYGDFPWLDMAWEAHKVRNHIAHSGAHFNLTHREAFRVFKLYERIFYESGHVS